MYHVSAQGVDEGMMKLMYMIIIIIIIMMMMMMMFQLTGTNSLLCPSFYLSQLFLYLP